MRVQYLGNAIHLKCQTIRLLEEAKILSDDSPEETRILSDDRSLRPPKCVHLDKNQFNKYTSQKLCTICNQ